jgi:hypothetical protein
MQPEVMPQIGAAPSINRKIQRGCLNQQYRSTFENDHSAAVCSGVLSQGAAMGGQDLAASLSCLAGVG